MTIRVPSFANSASALAPLLKECGYTGARLEHAFRFEAITIPLVGFASKPWDFDSACIAVVDSSGQPEAAVRSCRGLGAPVVWVRHDNTVDWWMQHGTAPTRFASKPVREFSAFVLQHQAKLDPVNIYRGKTIARVDPARQLSFVDAGYLPLLREEAGEKLHRLVEDMTRAMLKGLDQRTPNKDVLRNVFIAVFRMLAGKILSDKGVHGFKGLDLNDPSAILAAVTKHYNRAEPPPQLNRMWKTALASAASLFSNAGSFGIISPETLAYVYERTLVTKDLRKKLGIHATPPWLVDYMVWQLYDWIRDIPIEDRYVFEPACGHAPFLLSAMRLLRLEMQDQDDARIHTYLKRHIHGVEIDDFAREIARLSLTLADIPNPNGWDLQGGDMYASDVLMQEASRSRILFSNPPYEKFNETDKAQCEGVGHPVSHKKAVELLHRTLEHLRPGSVFGVVVPQTVVSGPEAKTIREKLLQSFEIAEICRFPGKVFAFAEAETAIILGRRGRTGQEFGSHRVRLRVVSEKGMSAFQHNYAVTTDSDAPQSRLSQNPAFELAIPALEQVWKALAGSKRLRDIASVGRGIEFKGKKARGGTPVTIAQPKAGYPAGYAGVSRDQAVFSLPPEVGVATLASLISNARQGMPDGVTKVLVNRTRTARSPWRIKALLDPVGKPVKNNFLTIRPKSPEIPALFLWAILNSPIANAFIASDTMKRDNAEGAIADIPIPRFGAHGIRTVIRLANAYREVATQRAMTLAAQQAASRRRVPLFEQPADIHDSRTDSEVREALLALDAAVLRLYALPVRLERQLLDYFRGHERRGVGCTFGDYFPSQFKSLVPLHKFISSGYRGSTVDEVADRMKPNESSPENEALRAATKAFGGDE